MRGEIDILEMKGHQPKIAWGTLHYGGAWPNNRHSGDQIELPVSMADEFHTFAVEWREGKISWAIDGQTYQTQTKWDSDGGRFPAPFDQEFHLILNIAVGGGFGGPVAPDTPFPAKMMVDYVRVYE